MSCNNCFGGADCILFICGPTSGAHLYEGLSVVCLIVVLEEETKSSTDVVSFDAPHKLYSYHNLRTSELYLYHLI